MTPAEALLVFTVEVSRASRDVGIPPPRVGAISTAQAGERYRVPGTTAAFVDWEGTGSAPVVFLVSWAQYSQGREFLRCVARHEVSHLKTGDHGHVLTGLLLRRRWNLGTTCNEFMGGERLT